MKRYAEYKDSGIEWIGEIPSEWAVGKIGYYYDIQLGKMLQPEKKTQSDTLESYLCAINIGKEGLKLDQIREMWFSSKEKEAYSIESDDLIVVEGGDVGTAIIYKGEIGTCYIQNALHRVRSHVSSNKFLLYWLAYLKERGYIDLICSKATIAHFTKDKFSNTIFLFPPIIAQLLITDYLDYKTAAIDELIADKRKLVALLQEKRNAIISEAVTKGLDKTVKMKDSGVDWIGEIPTHWKVTRIKNLFSLVDDRNADEESELLSLFTAIGVKPRSEMEERGNRSVTVLNYKKVWKGDLIVNKLLAWMGAIAYSDYQGVTSPDYDIYRKKDNADVIQDYYHHYFRNTNFKGDCFKYGHGIMMMRWRTYSNEFFNILALNPPMEEQQAIAGYVRKESDKIDSLISDITEQIKKLKEYRQAVISEAVTGKVAV